MMFPNGPDGRAGGGPARWTAAARSCLGAVLFVAAGGAALAQQQRQQPAQEQSGPRGQPPSRSDGQPSDWQRQQPTQERARALMREEGIQPSQEERRDELRSLNRMYRELVPGSGNNVPAPGVGTGQQR